MALAYLMTLQVAVGERWHADEIYTAVRGEQNYLFLVTCGKSRFCLSFETADRKDGHNATSLLRRAKTYAGKTPSEFVSDSLGSYGQAHEEVFAQRNPYDKLSTHVKDAGINKVHVNNNIQERLNGTFRDREKTVRGIKSRSSPLIPGFIIDYNFIRPHQALGKTPAEAAGIIIHGNDKWKTIIGNAALAGAA